MNWRRLISLAVGTIFWVLGYTGIRLYLLPHTTAMATLHTIMALIFCAIAVFHVVNNRRALLNYIGIIRSPKRPSKELMLCLIGAAAGWAAISLNVCGTNEIYDFGNQYRAAQQGKEVATDGTQTVEVFAASGELQLALAGSKGSAFKFPMFSMWMENLDSSDFRTLYVSQALATSHFKFGKKTDGKWEPAIVRRPQALPVWSHRYGHVDEAGFHLPPTDDPRLDAVSGATPTDSFIIHTGTNGTTESVFDIYFEVNQSFDWNETFSKEAFPDDVEYHSGKTGQPSVIYWTRVDRASGKTKYVLEPIGYGHPGGKDGEIVRNLSVLSTALEIIPLPILTIRSIPNG